MGRLGPLDRPVPVAPRRDADRRRTGRRRPRPAQPIGMLPCTRPLRFPHIFPVAVLCAFSRVLRTLCRAAFPALSRAPALYFFSALFPRAARTFFFSFRVLMTYTSLCSNAHRRARPTTRARPGQQRRQRLPRRPARPLRPLPRPPSRCPPRAATRRAPRTSWPSRPGVPPRRPGRTARPLSPRPSPCRRSRTKPGTPREPPAHAFFLLAPLGPNGQRHRAISWGASARTCCAPDATRPGPAPVFRRSSTPRSSTTTRPTPLVRLFRETERAREGKRAMEGLEGDKRGVANEGERGVVNGGDRGRACRPRRDLPSRPALASRPRVPPSRPALASRPPRPALASRPRALRSRRALASRPHVAPSRPVFVSRHYVPPSLLSNLLCAQYFCLFRQLAAVNAGDVHEALCAVGGRRHEPVPRPRARHRRRRRDRECT